jgi:Flp pilus assembly protein TadG
MSHRLHVRRPERGTALIEFALVLPFLICLTFAVVDLSRAFYIKNVLYQAAREGVRTAVVTTGADADVVEARVRQVAAAANINVSSVTIVADANRQLGVTVNTSFRWIFSGIFSWTGMISSSAPTDLKATAWMRRETP